MRREEAIGVDQSKTYISISETDKMCLITDCLLIGTTAVRALTLIICGQLVTKERRCSTNVRDYGSMRNVTFLRFLV